MFYSVDLLCRRGGRFGKVWKAATDIVKLTRRDVCGVCVSTTCEDILKYIMNQIAPLHPGGPRPRLSLYLSAQLMYGVVRIHRKHCEFLLADATGELIKIRSAVAALSTIDLSLPVRADLVTNPEPLYEDVDFDENVDLDVEFFLSFGEKPGPRKLEFWGMESTSVSSASIPRSPFSRSSSDGRGEPFQPLFGSPNTVTSLEEITMREVDTQLNKDSIAMMQVPPEEDLLQPFQEDLNAMPEPRLSVADLLRTTTPVPEKETRQRSDKDQSTVSSKKAKAGTSTPERRPRLEVPKTRAVPPSPGVTQPIITSPLPQRLELDDSFHLPPVLPSPARRKRRRQLAFADAETQLSLLEMKDFMKNHSDETCETRKIPDVHIQAADTLLKNPVRKKVTRSKNFRPLWQRNAIFRAGLSDQALEDQFGRFPDPVMSSDESVVPDELVSRMEESVELRRAGVDQSASLQAHLLEASASLVQTPSIPGDRQSRSMRTPDEPQETRAKRDRSKSRASVPKTPSVEDDIEGASIHSARSSLTAIKSESLHQLFNIQEETLPMQDHTIPEEVKLDISMVDDHDLSKRIEAELGYNDSTTFQKLYPPSSTSRKQAASAFHQLLKMCGSGKLVVYQKECFADIHITT